MRKTKGDTNHFFLKTYNFSTILMHLLLIHRATLSVHHTGVEKWQVGIVTTLISLKPTLWVAGVFLLAWVCEECYV